MGALVYINNVSGSVRNVFSGYLNVNLVPGVNTDRGSLAFSL